MEQKKIYYILCEGNSEVNYITKLNKFLDQENYNFTFCSENLYGCFPSKKDNEKSAYRRIIRIFEEKLIVKTSKGLFLIWLDNDIFKRQGGLKKQILEQKFSKFRTIHKKIEIIYSYENFEDFLSMHLDQKKFEKWESICSESNHFENPMIASIYEEKMQTIISNYSKEKLPSEIQINRETMLVLKERQNDKNFHAKCDLISFLLKEMKDI
jgi:hypothetical protein